MHYHIEVIIPPTDELETAVEHVLLPLSEHYLEDETEGRNPHGIWDFYVIGGRFHAEKMTQRLGRARLLAFEEELQERKFTVSSLRFGKPELSPASQIPEVDALWKERFPEWTGDHCPLFKHCGDQYENAARENVCRLGDIDFDLKASAVVFGRKPSESESKLAVPQFLVQQEIWNGLNFERTAWDGTVAGAVSLLYAKNKRYKNGAYRAPRTPDGDWLAVTVDIHS